MNRKSMSTRKPWRKQNQEQENQSEKIYQRKKDMKMNNNK